MNIKKHLYYPFIIFSIPISIVYLSLYSILCLVKVFIRVVNNLIGRVEWWMCDCHRDSNQPLNPFNETFKQIWNEEFNL